MEPVTSSIINVGVNDREITLFESQYHLEKGMAYNSYVILDDKVAVMDTVDPRATKEWLKNLQEALSGRSVDYLVVQHMEPDHGGSIKALLELFPQMQLVGTAQAFQMIRQFFDLDIDRQTIAVKEGDTLQLGSHTLQFIQAPMVHWPEVLVTYEQSEQVVFSADGFGKFGTRDAEEDWTCEARRYYFNICGKYGMQVQMLLKKLAPLQIRAICPLHGPVLTEDLGYYIDKYAVWSSYEPEDEGILIAYASIHGNTAAAALKFKEILEAAGEKKVVVTDLCRDDLHEAVEDAFRYDCLVLASASYDAGVFPAMETFLAHLKAKTFRNRTVALIENGTWAPSAAKTMKAALEGMKDIRLVEPVITIRSAMKEETVEQMKILAEQLRKRNQK